VLGSGAGPAVLAALRALPRRQREVIALRVFLDLDIATTAGLLGIAPGTVGAHLSGDGSVTVTLRELTDAAQLKQDHAPRDLPLSHSPALRAQD
jgi:Sigma-70, region 4